MDSAWFGLLGTIVGGLITVGGQAYLARKPPDRVRESAKVLLRGMLDNERYQWRNIRSLANVIGLPHDQTRELLLEIGARGSELNPELWGLVSRNPLIQPPGVQDATLEG